jgi:hypothetical protein
VIDLTMDEILEDLCYPGLPPGRWNVPAEAILHEAGELVPDAVWSASARITVVPLIQEEQPCHGPRRRSSSTTPRR